MQRIDDGPGTARLPRFADSWALVTGASSGLGEEFATQLASRGANVVLTARSGSRLEGLAGQLKQAHRVEARVLVADLSTDAGLTTLLRSLDATGLAIDHVVANAGYGTFGELATQTEESQLDMIRLNCVALVGLVRHFLPGQIARKRGGALLVASTASFQPTPLYATYGATKHFVRAFGEALAEEVRPSGVTISVLCPGPVATGFQSRAGTIIAPAQARSVLTSAETVRQGLEGYAHGRTVVVPGTMNRALRAVSSVLPNRVIAPMTLRMMRTKERE
jgi:short-subunit dehydrogenase